MQEKDFKAQNYNFLGKNTCLEGDLKFFGDTILHGSIKGTITMANDAKLTLERASNFEGTIFCHNLDVFGDLKGTVKSSAHLSVRSSAVVSGSIQAKKMTIYPGAILNIEGHTDDNMNTDSDSSGQD